MTTPQEDLLPATRRALLHRIAVAQAEGRAPSLVAAVVRGGRTVWHGSRTSVDGHAPDENVQYRIGSITKTFTAVLVMRLRDEGLLDLGDPLEKHLPGTVAGEVTIAELLSHTSGLAAESPAPWWERTPGSLRPELADVLGEQPFLHAAGRRFHYSNPGYTLLGALVEKLREPRGRRSCAARCSSRWTCVARAGVLERPTQEAGRCIPGPMSCFRNRPRTSGGWPRLGNCGPRPVTWPDSRPSWSRAMTGC
ncbi:D-alanyl-D-alanine carboxypeptidase [Streptomyces sp. MBT84]|nr:D-alanyl-D-alanine carboxypeptidase [Streptomyces sp. MBT84]